MGVEGGGGSSYLEVSRVLVTLGSAGITAGLYLQMSKIWRTKSAADFSSVLVLTLLLNELCWLNYGIALFEWPILLVCSANIPAILRIIHGYWRYGGARRRALPQLVGVRSMKIGRYHVRQAMRADFLEIVALDAKAFDGMEPIGVECLEAWSQVHPEGFLVAVDSSDKIVSYAMTIRLEPRDIHHNWLKDTARGTGRTHNPNGSVLYGVSLASMALGAGQAVYLGERYLAERLDGVTQSWLYGRLRGFRAWAAGNDGEHADLLNRYVALHIDPIQMFYVGLGGVVVGAVPGYFPGDDESLGCAVHTVWQKPSWPDL